MKMTSTRLLILVVARSESASSPLSAAAAAVLWSLEKKLKLLVTNSGFDISATLKEYVEL
jgi:hypothetical protein